MKLIKDDSRHTFQRRVALQASGQNAFGHNLDEGVRSGLVVQLDTVANRFANRLAQRLRHPPGCRPRRQTTRFQDDNPAALAPGRIQKPQRNPRGFPGARCCLYNGIRRVLKACTEFRQYVVDWQFGHGARSCRLTLP